MVGFIFGGNTGETPESLKRKRSVAEALAGRSSLAPKNVGEGLTAVGNALLYRSLMNKVDAGDAAGRAAADADRDAFLTSYGSPAADALLGPSGGAGNASIPMPEAANEVAATSPVTGDTFEPFISTVKEGGLTNPYGLAAVASTVRAESGWDPKNFTRTWNDPSESGKPGRSGGAMSWRGPRYDALAATGDLSPQGQARFFLQEDPSLIEKLNGAKSIEEAQSLINNAWAFAGYDRPSAEVNRRLGYAKGYLPSFQGGTEVASLDPAAGMGAAQAIDAAATPSGQAPQVQPPEFDMGRFGPNINLAEMPPSRADIAPQMQRQTVDLGGMSPVATALASPPNNATVTAPQTVAGALAKPTSGGQPALRPFRAGETRPNADGTYSTELTTTWQLPDGSWVNAPSLWMGQNGPQQFDPRDEEGILGALRQYEAQSGQPLPRFSSLEQAESAAQTRSANGGAGAPPQAQPPRNQVAQALMREDYYPAAPSAPTQSGPSMQQIMRVLNNPYATDSDRAMAAAELERRQKQSDPVYQFQLQKLQREATAPAKRGTTTINGRLVDDQTGQIIADIPDQVKPTASQQDYEYYRDFETQNGRQPLGPLEWEQAQRKAGASQTINNVGGDTGDLYKELDKNVGKTFSDLSNEGMRARGKLAQIDRLEGLLSASPSGAGGAIKLALGEWGINTEGLNELQASQALINELVPQQRQPGSGPMSDADLALFKQSLPRIISQPGGNKLILDTMRGITQYQMQMGEIADMLADRAELPDGTKVTPAVARKMIRDLPNPLDAFTASIRDRNKQQGGPTTDAPPAPQGVDAETWKYMTPEERSLWQ